MSFKRFRQLRLNQSVRDANADISLQLSDIIYPYFVIEGEGKKEAIASIDGVFRFSLDTLLVDLAEISQLGISKILLLGVYDSKNTVGTLAEYSEDNFFVQAIKCIKEHYPFMMILADVSLGGSVQHGPGDPSNDEAFGDTQLPLFAQMALSYALAGADIVAPSAMIDGQVQAVKLALADNDLYRTKVMGSSATFASSFIGSFTSNDATAPLTNVHESAYIDYRTIRQGIEQIEADVEQGANWIMVKPALSYLDIIYRGKQLFPSIPMVAYQTSGEYAMLVAAADKGFVDFQKAMIESLTSIKRAGANFIVTHYGKELAKQVAPSE